VTVGLENYFDKKINESHISSSTNKKDAFKYLMESVDESSSENNIIVNGIVDFSASPHNVNKKLINSKWGKKLKMSILLALASTCSNFQKVSTLSQLIFFLQAFDVWAPERLGDKILEEHYDFVVNEGFAKSTKTGNFYFKFSL